MGCTQREQAAEEGRKREPPRFLSLRWAERKWPGARGGASPKGPRGRGAGAWGSQGLRAAVGGTSLEIPPRDPTRRGMGWLLQALDRRGPCPGGASHSIDGGGTAGRRLGALPWGGHLRGHSPALDAAGASSQGDPRGQEGSQACTSPGSAGRAAHRWPGRKLRPRGFAVTTLHGKQAPASGLGPWDRPAGRGLGSCSTGHRGKPGLQALHGVCAEVAPSTLATTGHGLRRARSPGPRVARA